MSTTKTDTTKAATGSGVLKEATPKNLVLTIVGLIAASALAVALLMGWPSKAHAQDAATVDAIDKVETAVAASSVDAITPAEVKSGVVCEVTLPADHGLVDTIKAKFDQLGCEWKVYTDSSGNVKAEAGVGDVPTAPTVTPTTN